MITLFVVIGLLIIFLGFFTYECIELANENQSLKTILFDIANLRPQKNYASIVKAKAQSVFRK